MVSVHFVLSEHTVDEDPAILVFGLGQPASVTGAYNVGQVLKVPYFHIHGIVA